MRRILSGILSFYWSLVFAIIAFDIVCAENGIENSDFTPGLNFVSSLCANKTCAIVFAAGFAFASVVFIWATATSALSHPSAARENDEVLRNAFAVGAVVLLGSCIASAFRSGPGVLVELSTQFGVLAASYAAVMSESSSVRVLSDHKQSARQQIVSVMAKGAAHESLLPGLLTFRTSHDKVNS